MASLQEFRQQYPQYNDMSDQQLSDSLYKKHYSDIPREQFNSKLGIKSETPSVSLSKGQGPNIDSPALAAMAEGGKPLAALGGGASEGVANVYSQATGNPAPRVPQQLEETMLQHPVASALGKAVGTVGPTLAATAVAPSAGLAGALAQGTLGMGLAGPGNRVAGFIGGSTIPIAAQKALGGIGTFLASNKTVAPVVTKFVRGLQKDLTSGKDIHLASNEAFSQFKSTPGTINTADSVNAINNTIKDIAPNLTKRQTAFLTEIKAKIANSKNIEDLHEARKAFTNDLDDVLLDGNKKLYGDSRKAIINLKKSLESDLQTNAKNIGALGDYQKANQLYKQSREADIVNDALKKATSGDESVSYITFMKKMNDLKPELARSLSPESRQALEGIQKIVKQSNELYGQNLKGTGLLKATLNILNFMTNVPGMKQLLIKAGTEKGKVFSRDLTRSIFNSIQAEGINMINPSEDINTEVNQ